MLLHIERLCYLLEAINELAEIVDQMLKFCFIMNGIPSSLHYVGLLLPLIYSGVDERDRSNWLHSEISSPLEEMSVGLFRSLQAVLLFG